MRESILHAIEGLGVSPEIAVLLLATLPIFELRGSIPIGLFFFKLPVWNTVALSIVGNMLPIVFILLLLEPAYKWLSRYPRMERFFDWLFKRTRRKGKLIERLELVGLAVFVGIPLPMTGAWTGSVAAFLFRIPFWKAFLSILCGVCMAAFVVTLACLGVIQLPGIFGVSSPGG
jgi:uncharacterized membrane protein